MNRIPFETVHIRTETQSSLGVSIADQEYKHEQDKK